MNTFIDAVRARVRRFIRVIARVLNALTGGRITPTFITCISLLAHLPIAWLIAKGYFGYASLGLVIFGLFDALDGELARLQHSETRFGMFFDSVTDRMKEILVYVGAGYVLVTSGQQYWAVWAIIACGSALLVSYTNAWGEAVSAGSHNPGHAQNKTYRSGIMSFDVRIFVLIAGLLFNMLSAALVIITIGSLLTALQRMSNVKQKLKDV